MKNKNLLLIGGLIAVYFLFRKKKNIGIVESLPFEQKRVIKDKVKSEIEKLNFKVFPTADQFYKSQYLEDIESGKV